MVSGETTEESLEQHILDVQQEQRGHHEASAGADPDKNQRVRHILMIIFTIFYAVPQQTLSMAAHLSISRRFTTFSMSFFLSSRILPPALFLALLYFLRMGIRRGMSRCE